MAVLSREALEARSGDWDALAAATTGVSTVCSSLTWQLTAHDVLHPQRELHCLLEDGAGLLLARGPLFSLGMAWQPLELGWCFASSLVGKASDTVALLESKLHDGTGPTRCLLGGIGSGSPMELALRKQLDRRFRFQAFEGMHCVQGSLEGGWNGYLGRRSARFRKAIERAEEEAAAMPVKWEEVGSACRLPEEADRLLDRVEAVEQRSWKEPAQVSVFGDTLHRRFYRELTRRYAAAGQLRLVLGVDGEGEDVAYVLGARVGATYRGFQMGFDARFRALGLGNAAQAYMIRQLCAEGVETYDLGMEIDYKRRWGETRLELVNLVLLG